MKEKILFVDDDPKILSAFSRGLRKEFDFRTATGAEQALNMISKDGPFAVVISDQQMPGMKGTEFLEEVMSREPMAVRIMLTGNADRDTAVSSINKSQVFRYLNKPCPTAKIAETTREAVAHYHRSMAEKELLEGTLAGSVKVLIDILGANEPQVVQQMTSLRDAGRRFARHVRLQKAWVLDMAITLSPVGEAMLPPHLRAKLIDGQALDQVETDLVVQSPQVARDLLLNIPRMSDVADAVYYKNKWFDGSGFPGDDKKGEDIPLFARVISLLQFLVDHSENGVPDRDGFSKLEDQNHLFDPKLVQQARSCFLENADVDTYKLVKISVQISGIQPGDKLVDSIKTLKGENALSAGTEMTEALIQRMRQFNKMRPLAQPVRVVRKVKASATPSNDTTSLHVH